MQIYQKDLAELGAALAHGLDAQRFGSFAARHPGLGKMVTCQFCHARRREFVTERCCNVSHANTKRAWDSEQGFHQIECAPRVIEAPFSKSVVKKMLHKKHGQNREWRRRMLTADMQKDVHLVEKALMDMYARPCRKWDDIIKFAPTEANLPAFADQYYTWKCKQESRRERKKRG